MNNIEQKMVSKPITLFDILKLMIDRHWPVSTDGDHVYIDSPYDADRVTICFTDDEDSWLTCDAQNAILVPWYGCKVYGLGADEDRKTVLIWVDFEHFLKEEYLDWLWERKNRT